MTNREIIMQNHYDNQIYVFNVVCRTVSKAVASQLFELGENRINRLYDMGCELSHGRTYIVDISSLSDNAYSRYLIDDAIQIINMNKLEKFLRDI